MAQNELTLPIEKEPRFKIEKETSDGTKICSYEHSPHLSILCPDPNVILIPAMTLNFFCPPAVEQMNQCGVGDLINVSFDPKTNKVYQAANLSPEWQIEDNFNRMFTIDQVAEDAMGLKVFLCKLAV